MLYSVLSLLSLLGASAAMNSTLSANIGNSLWRTFGHQTALPITKFEAEQNGWVAITGCNENLGILYAQSADGVCEKHPLGLYFSQAGQIAGVQVTVYGSNKDVGDAAPANLVKLGYWKQFGTSWHLDVSFRPPTEMCSNTASEHLIGSRVVINQDTIKVALPLTAGDARQKDWTQGSCMSSMGQHHFYDLTHHPEQSYEYDQLLPVVAMYNPPFDEKGKLNAFFITSPVAQPGSSAWYLLTGAADWESPALTSKLMCQNWCDDDNCRWSSSWATMHIYLSSEWDGLECPGGSGPVGRSCDIV